MPTQKEKNQQYFLKTISDTRDLLTTNTEWINRFKGYADKILANTNNIRLKKKQFHEWAPLYLYLNVGKAGSAAQTVHFSLRYHGQEVADLSVSNSVKINTSDYNSKNKRDFNCTVTCDCGWRDKDANDLRKHFATAPARLRTADNKGNEEHRIESMFLTELSQKKGILKKKELHNIQPVKIGGVSRFQMATPIRASKDLLKYSVKGGGVDILARAGNGPNTRLCVMEVKDEYTTKEPPKEALAQGLAYATFIRELLRSPDVGETWWKIFGFSRKIPNDLTIYVASVMPFNPNGPSEEIIYDELPIGNDKFKLHHIYFSEEGTIKNIKTSF